MIKKTIAIFFILIANIVLLVHAVVPHHHHESSVCIEKISYPECDTHNHGLSCTGCNHHNESNSQNCLLKLVVYLPSNQENQVCKSGYILCKYSQYDSFQAVINNAELNSFLPLKLSEKQKLLNTFPTSKFKPSSSGLRAPPVV